MEGLNDMDPREWESIHCDYDSDHWVTMVGWADVPDGDRIDFRHPRAIDRISLLH